MTDRAISAALVHPRPFRLFDATARLLRSAARTAPLLVVLDDLHWADEASLLLLQHLVRELDYERIMLLANARPKRGDEHDVLASLLRELVTTSLEMKGLDAVGVRRQLATIERVTATPIGRCPRGCGRSMLPSSAEISFGWPKRSLRWRTARPRWVA